MSTNVTSEFHSVTWRSVLRRYADGLLDTLEQDLSGLSGTGIPLNSDDRITLLMQETEAEADECCPDDRPVAPHVADLTQLDHWLADQSGPLLLLGPFGAGKSVLMAYFACRLAKDVICWCDNSKDSQPFPPVPLAVRLREWEWHDKQKFIDYICDLSQERLAPNVESVLTAKQIRTLAEKNALLPLYDGVDELPVEGGTRRTALDAMAKFTRRYILSSRPGHGVEELETFAGEQSRYLHDLNVDDAEQFIRRRSRQHDDLALVAYRRSQPHINELFRRPLCLAAWCEAYRQTPRQPPESLSEMMEVVLEQVLDERIFRGKTGLPVENAGQVLSSKHQLGAVLASYAENGFGKLSSTDDVELNRDAIEDPRDIDRWRELAVRAGLLIRAGPRCHTIKTPVVEYLIGSFYAWLTESAPDEGHRDRTLRRQRQFVAKFRKGFWWRDFDDVWLYTFDRLWRGTNEQVEIASGIVEWMLRFSERCMDCGQYTGDLLAGQTDDDREPFTCHRFAVRVLLPTSRVELDVQPRVKEHLRRGLTLTIAECLKKWRHLRNSEDSLEGLSRRWPNELVSRLEELFRHESGADVRRETATAIKSVLTHLDPRETRRVIVDTLIPCLLDTEYKREWSLIVDCIGRGLTRLDTAAAHDILSDTLIPCLLDTKYKREWSPIVAGIGRGLSRLDAAAAHGILTDMLVSRLFNAEYERTWPDIVDYIGKGLDRVDEAATRIILAEKLVPRLVDTECEKAWPTIAKCIGRALARLDTTPAQEALAEVFLRCSLDAEYEEAWTRVADCIFRTWACSDPAAAQDALINVIAPRLPVAECEKAWIGAVDKLRRGGARLDPATAQDVFLKVSVPCLLDTEYKEEWSRIAICIGERLPRLGPAAVENVLTAVLVPCLLDTGYKEARPGIAYGINDALAHLDPLSVKNVLTAVLVPCLLDAGYKEARPVIAIGIKEGLASLDPAAAQEVLTKMLVPSLRNKKYKKAWSEIADGIDTGLARLEPAAAQAVVTETLIPCLLDAKYEDAWCKITNGIDSGLDRLDPATAQAILTGMLIPRLLDTEYKEAWPYIAANIGHGMSRLDAAATESTLIKTLIPCLLDPKYGEVWQEIGMGTDVGLSFLAPAIVQDILTNMLMPCLLNLEYKNAWDRIVDRIDGGLRRLDPATAEGILTKTLVPCMFDASFSDVWMLLRVVIGAGGYGLSAEPLAPIAREFGAQGRINDLIDIVNAVPSLLWFVRRIVNDVTLKRIEYSVCERNSSYLRFDPELQAPPPDSIRFLCDGPVMRGAPHWIESTEIKCAIEKALRDHVNDTSAHVFRRYVGEGRKQTVAINRLADMIEALLTLEQRQAYRRPADDAGKSPKSRARSRKTSRTNKRLALNEEVLKDALAKDGILLAISKVVGAGRDVDWFLIESFENPRYGCPECGALTRPNLLDKKQPRPDECIACGYAFKDGDKPKDYQGEVLVCREGEPIEFAVYRRSKVWPNRTRQAGMCPAQRCKKRKHHLM